MHVIEFIFSFLLPFQDLPRITLLGFELRPSMVTVPILGINFLMLWFNKKIKIGANEKKTLIALSGLAVYLLLHTLILGLNSRAVGFLFWFLINAFALVYAMLVRSEWLAKGYLAAVLFGCVHILLQRFDPFLAVSPIKILQLVDYQAHVRVFSWFGEPSFACLNLLFVLTYTLFKSERAYLLISIALLTAIAFTYSRMGYLGASILLLLKLYFQIKNKTPKAITLAQFSAAILIYIATNVLWVHEYKYETWANVANTEEFNTITGHVQQKIKYKPDEQVNLRKYALLRGIEVIKQHPLLGVGLGNSKAYIMENKIRSEFRGIYEGLHNLYQEIWAEVGLIGLVLFLIFLITAFPFVYIKGTASPYLFTLVYPMQFCQNINMPILWLGLITSYYFYRSRIKC